MSAPPLVFQVLAVSSGTCPVARYVGRTQDGASVAVTVTRFKPFFYVKLDAPGLLLADGAVDETGVALLRSSLSDALDRRFPRGAKGSQDRWIAPVAVVSAHDYLGYAERPSLYARLEFVSAEAHTAARFALAAPAGAGRRQAPFTPSALRRLFGEQKPRFVLAEANIAYEHQVLDRLGLRPGAWVAVDSAAARKDWNSKFATHAYEAQLGVGLSHAAVDRAAPVRVLCWDLEVFCTPLGDGAMKFFDGDDPSARLLCVSMVTFEYGVAGGDRATVFCLKPSSGEGELPAEAGDGVRLEWFDTDRDLIVAFFAAARAYDPDVLTGWNTLRFDWPWLWKRCEALGLRAAFGSLSRWDAARFDDSPRAWQCVCVPGRVVHDCMEWLKKNRSLREYGLEYACTCSELGLGLDGKDDVSYADIAPLSRTAEGCAKLAVYCAKDSQLVSLVMRHRKLDILGKTLAQAALMAVPPEDLLFRGSMHLLRLAMLRAAHEDGFLLSSPSRSADDQPLLADPARYSGGKVLAPLVGYYTAPVVTLDFSSLYPSVMQELNVCASTRLTRAAALALGLPFLQPPAPALEGLWFRGDARVARLRDESDASLRLYTYATRAEAVGRYETELNEAVVFPDGSRALLEDGGYALRWADGDVWRRRDEDVLVFVDHSVREGSIPLRQRALKEERNRAKKAMAAAQAAGGDGAAYWDNYQNAVKLLMNALYGALGSGKGGIYPESAPLASAITARGRALIVLVKKTIEERLWLAPDGACGGFLAEPCPPGAAPLRVLYGDSVAAATPVLVRVGGAVTVKTVASLSAAWEDYRGFKPGQEGLTSKQQAVLTGVEAWTAAGWAPVRRVVRHRCGKRMARVATETALVDVTEDHSLLSPEGAPLEPCDVEVGTALMHSFPPDCRLADATVDELRAAVRAARGGTSMRCASHLAAARQYLLLRAMGLQVHVRATGRAAVLLHWGEPVTLAGHVKQPPAYSESDDDAYVYDLETSAGSFQAGVGQMIVKNTDSVMVHFPGCSLQAAAEAAARIERFFLDGVLKPPHKLAFEKVLGGQGGAVAFYRKKMYAAVKYEDGYGPDAVGKLFVRGLSAIRRDNASVTKDTVTAVMKLLFLSRAPREDVVDFCGRTLALIHNSAVAMHGRGFDGRLPLEAFVQSAGISKGLDDYDAETAATAVARQLLALDPQSGVGKNSRVTFVVTVRPGAKRSQQAMLPSQCLQERAMVDGEHYVAALLKKLAPLLSVLFTAEARAARRMRDVYGVVVDVPPASKAAQTRLLGEEEAERAILQAYRRCRLLKQESELRQAPAPAAAEPAKRKRLAGGGDIRSFFR